MQSFQVARPGTASPGADAKARQAPGTAMTPAGGQAAELATVRPEAPTPRVLSLWRAASVLVCLAVAVVTPLALNQNRASLTEVNDAAQQLMRLQLVRGDVLAADADAAGELVAAQTGAEPTDSYLTGLQDAASMLSLASAASVPDQDALSQANEELTGYAVSVARAVEAQDPELMTTASAQLRDEFLPGLDAQIELNQARLSGSIADQRWLGLLAVAPVLVLLLASVAVARRTRRVLNLGLVLALGLSAAMGVVTTQVVTRSADSVGAARQGEVVQATSAVQAYASVTEAKAWEARTLLGTASAAEGEEQYTAAMDAARSALANVPGADGAGMVAHLDAMAGAHAQMVDADDPGQAAAASTAQTSYEALVDWLPDQASTIGTGVYLQLTSHAQIIRAATGGTAAAMLLAAVAAGVGISQPLRRYR
ncbi:hypothetical protein GCM10009785_24030 [Brooklawnia cerclae]|uniref:Uncharacterized protein n=1 Tax=Brooklawnia cerclae TaxID=349934 RepID=A0ABX0SG79_9ACTN|nr:hypothetical protein [Brooklawnia cerclae]NIH55631.1 hypothetical protein [Brooklawnia cerclae]